MKNTLNQTYLLKRDLLHFGAEHLDVGRRGWNVDPLGRGASSFGAGIFGPRSTILLLLLLRLRLVVISLRENATRRIFFLSFFFFLNFYFGLILNWIPCYWCLVSTSVTSNESVVTISHLK